MDAFNSNDPDLQAKFEERRRARRGACDHTATVRRRGCFAVHAHAADLTAEGCRIRGAGPFPVGNELWVRLDGLESLPSRVIWSDYGLTGARFDHPLHPAVVARYLPATSRMALIAERAAEPSPAAALDDELSALSRRARIMRGVAERGRGSGAFARPAGIERRRV